VGRRQRMGGVSESGSPPSRAQRDSIYRGLTPPANPPYELRKTMAITGMPEEKRLEVVASTLGEMKTLAHRMRQLM